MESRAVLKFARVSPQKARLVADLVRGRDASEAIELLTFEFADATLRSFAVDWLSDTVDDSDLLEVLPQLVQCLKFEPYHEVMPLFIPICDDVSR